MKKIVFLFLMIIAQYPLHAQLGINVQYEKNDFKSWNEVLNMNSGDTHTIFKNSYKIGLDYGFSLRTYRISFYPEFNFKWSKHSFENNLSKIDMNLKQFGFNFKTQIYPLDLLGKRSLECPSFYRGMDKIRKGWFFQFSPEFSYSSKSLQDETEMLEYSKIIFLFGIGTGLDIGITPNISISPVIKYAFSMGEKWDGFSNYFGEASHNDGSAESHVSLGIRLGLWF